MGQSKPVPGRDASLIQQMTILVFGSPAAVVTMDVGLGRLTLSARQLSARGGELECGLVKVVGAMWNICVVRLR